MLVKTITESALSDKKKIQMKNGKYLMPQTMLNNKTAGHRAGRKEGDKAI